MRLNMDRITDFKFCWQKDLFLHWYDLLSESKGEI